MKGMNPCGPWFGALTRSIPLQIQKSLWFLPLETRSDSLPVHPAPISSQHSKRCPHSVVFSRLQILAQMPHLQTWPLSRPHPEQDSDTFASELGRTHLLLHKLSANCLIHTHPSCAYVTSKECVTCKCSFLPYGASVHSTEDKRLKNLPTWICI